jgi:hypothetical protein
MSILCRLTGPVRTMRAARGRAAPWLATVGLAALAGCTGAPLAPFTADAPPLVLVPAAQAGVQDQRGRFREVYCAVLQARAADVPDHRPCDDALTRLGTEPAGTGRPVALGAANRRLVAAVVPGIGYDCVAQWMQPQGTIAAHIGKYGYEMQVVKVDALSGTTRNARQVRDAVMAMEPGAGAPRIVLFGYSKGAPDVLEAIVSYPEMHARVAAVVSIAGAVGGSALANDAEQYQADLLRHFPGARCDVGDGGGVESLRPNVRHAWMARHPLPPGVPYYSVVTLPQPERISGVLRRSAEKMARIDGRNDSQVLYYDQVIPGSTLLGYVNADHWAIALPIARAHATIGSLFVTRNDYPREALMEAILRYLDEDLARPGKQPLVPR